MAPIAVGRRQIGTTARELRPGILAALLALLAAWSTVHVQISADATVHVQTAYSFLLEGNGDVDEYVALPPPLTASRVALDGHWYAPYTSGNALLYVLPAAIAWVLGIDPRSFEGAGVVPKIVASLFVAISVVLVYTLAARILDRRRALFVAFAYAFGTAAFGAAQQYSQHAATLMLGSAVLVSALSGRARAAGMLGGLAVIVRPPSAFLVAAVFAFLLRERGSAAGRPFLLWMLPAAAFQLTASAIEHGSPFFTGGPVPLGSLPEGAIGVLVSPSRGLLVYSPWLLASFASLALAWRGPADAERRLLRYGGIAFVGVWLLFGSYAEWWGGWTFGDRYLSDLAPLYALALADAFRRGWLDRPLARAALAAGMAWAVLLQAVGAGLYLYTWNGRHWDVTPDINATPWRLWDWTDTQWQFLLRRYVTDPGPAMIVESAVILACIAAFAILSGRVALRPVERSGAAARM